MRVDPPARLDALLDCLLAIRFLPAGMTESNTAVRCGAGVLLEVCGMGKRLRLQ